MDTLLKNKVRLANRCNLDVVGGKCQLEEDGLIIRKVYAPSLESYYQGFCRVV